MTGPFLRGPSINILQELYGTYLLKTFDKVAYICIYMQGLSLLLLLRASGLVEEATIAAPVNCLTAVFLLR